MVPSNASQKETRSEQPMAPIFVRLIGIYHIVVPLLLVYFLCRIWPASSPEKTNTFETISLFRGIIEISMSWEVRLILIVLATGMLGSFIQTGQSLIRRVGQKTLDQSYAWWYVLRPLIGSILALIFYFVIRGGLLSVSAGAEAISHFGIAATAGIVGLFSRYAIDKLREVFTTLFATTEKGGEEDKSKKVAADTTPEKDT